MSNDYFRNLINNNNNNKNTVAPSQNNVFAPTIEDKFDEKEKENIVRDTRATVFLLLLLLFIKFLK